MIQRIDKVFAANVSYGSITQNAPTLFEYRHTGRIFYKNKNHSTSNEEIASKWVEQGKKVKVSSGHYFIDRIAIHNEKGGWWYINNEGDFYTVNKVSKYARRIHSELSQEGKRTTYKPTHNNPNQ